MLHPGDGRACILVLFRRSSIDILAKSRMETIDAADREPTQVASHAISWCCGTGFRTIQRTAAGVEINFAFCPERTA